MRSSPVSRIVATTSSFTGSGSCSMCESSSTVEASAHCRSSRISTTGFSRATKAISRVTAANSRKRSPSASPSSGARSGAIRRRAGMKRPSSETSWASSAGKRTWLRWATRCWIAAMNGW